jgi:hypothetical protein
MHKTAAHGRTGTTTARTWLSIRVELVEGRGQHYWPRPGRLFAAARSHSYGKLATAIDDAFARWDRSHLHEFEFADGTRIGTPNAAWDNEDVLDETRERTSHASRPRSNSSTCSTLVTTGHTCAPSWRRALIHMRLSVWFPTSLCRTSGGGISRINTGGLGLETTRSLHLR